MVYRNKTRVYVWEHAGFGLDSFTKLHFFLQGWNRDRSISSEETYNQKKVTQQRISREIAELAEKYGCTLAQVSTRIYILAILT